MIKHIAINKHSVHLWRVDLSASPAASLMHLLSSDEMTRANQFKFDIHRHRFIVARAMLRQVLSFYTRLLPEEIVFSYGDHGKPFLRDNPLQIQFNISHSDNLAVIAVTIEHDIGVDIEKMEITFKDAVAKRFFSPQEYNELQQLPSKEQVVGFYRIWSKKEAVIKAIGAGLYVRLDSFSLSTQHKVESIEIVHNDKHYRFHVESFFVDNAYQASFATNQTVTKIEHFPV